MVAPGRARAPPAERKSLQTAAVDELPTTEGTWAGAEYPRGVQTMSFRSRLSLFFTIIVVVPMVAVALVLFSIMADSETGKTDAEIAQGLRAAFAVYDADRAGARDALHTVAGNTAVGQALAVNDVAALRTALTYLARATPGVRAVAAFDPARRPLAVAGSSDAIAMAAAAPTSRGHSVGFVAVSTTGAGAFALQVRRVTGLYARVSVGCLHVAAYV